jgi:hypothetical protein
MRKIILTLIITKSLMSCGQDTVAVKTVVLPSVKSVAVVEPTIDSTKINKELLVKYILHKEIEHPEVAYAIARQESNMCSRLFQSNNNLFGMRQPGVRPTKSKGPKYGFASFEKWQHSVDDYKLYLEFVQGHKLTRDGYLRHLDRSYAHAGYSRVLVRYFEEFNLILKSL